MPSIELLCHTAFITVQLKSSSAAFTPLAISHMTPSTHIFVSATPTYTGRRYQHRGRFHRLAGLPPALLMTTISGKLSECLFHRCEGRTLRPFNLLKYLHPYDLTTPTTCKKYEKILCTKICKSRAPQISAGLALWASACWASELSFGNNKLNLTVLLLVGKHPLVFLTKVHTEHFYIKKPIKVFEEKVSRTNKPFQNEPPSQE